VATSSPASVSAVAGLAGVDPFFWRMDTDGKERRPRLRYVSPETGETKIRMECEPSGTIYIYLEAPPQSGGTPSGWPFKLLTGDFPSLNPGQVVPRSDGMLEIIGAFPPTDGVLTVFRSTGVMSLSDARHPEPLPIDAATREERGAVGRFFDRCAAPANGRKGQAGP
jgi:hypothetical protein